jgi:multicomponent K+:H+ antiporter subunit E
LKRWLPTPLLSFTLLISWLLLNQSLEPAHIVLGALLGLLIPVLLRPLMPLPPLRMARPWVLVPLLSMALVEIVRSCFNVSRIILFGMPKGAETQFLRIPLDLKDPYGLTLLACLINSTPGTTWTEYFPETNELILHVFDLHDEQWWIDTIKHRYEFPIIEAFEGRVLQ